MVLFDYRYLVEHFHELFLAESFKHDRYGHFIFSNNDSFTVMRMDSDFCRIFALSFYLLCKHLYNSGFVFFGLLFHKFP